MNRRVNLLDYGAGNLTSVTLALRRLGAEITLVERGSDMPPTGMVVFPGVGSAGSGMAAVRGRGFDAAICRAVSDGRPVLGICLGMQLLFEDSEEDGGQFALGVLQGHVRRFEFPGHPELKIPEIGWNGVFHGAQHAAVWRGIPDGTPFYFVHSYYVTGAAEADVRGSTEYGGNVFTSAVGHGSLFATQFHPERSGEAGLQLLENILSQC